MKAKLRATGKTTKQNQKTKKMKWTNVNYTEIHEIQKIRLVGIYLTTWIERGVGTMILPLINLALFDVFTRTK